jgi:hypothetical protein
MQQAVQNFFTEVKQRAVRVGALAAGVAEAAVQGGAAIGAVGVRVCLGVDGDGCALNFARCQGGRDQRAGGLEFQVHWGSRLLNVADEK